MKPFWKSRKFVYALGTALAALVLAFLPEVVVLDPETQDLLGEMLPLVFVIGLSVILGHTVTDVAAIWRSGVQGKPLADALKDLIDALTEALQEERPIENLDEIKAHIQDLLSNLPEEQG